MEILAQFLLRLAFGLAVGMGITSPRQVSSGFFRNHLYVALGLATLAVLAVVQTSNVAAGFAAAAAVLSFFGAACWLYEAEKAGRAAIRLVAACALIAALLTPSGASTTKTSDIWQTVAAATSGLVLGLVLAAMLLGHWYLNSPGMQLAPLRRLLAAAAIAVAIQALISLVGLVAEYSRSTEMSTNWLIFVALRWLFGIIGVMTMLWMAWRTLDVPNTQSATGILYVAVIGVFVGELAAALLSAESAFPL